MAASVSCRRVVLADDDPEVRYLVAVSLELAGGVELVAEAASADEVLTAVEVCHPDCLILDVVMPGVSGLEVLRRLRRTDDWTAVVILSGSVTPDVHEEADRAGADVVLEKDEAFVRLGAAVERAIIRRRAKRTHPGAV